MTGSDIKEFTENVLDGLTLDDTFFYQLLNIAKDKVEGERTWQFLKKLDSSRTASSGSNPDTVIPLPTDFAQDYKVEVGIRNEYFPVGFEEQHIFRSSPRRYFIDLANNGYHLLGSVVSGTIYFFYKRFTDDLTSTTSPVWPTRYHSLLGFMVAGYYQTGVDSDEIFARMGPINRSAALELKAAMENWDASLALRAQNDRVGMEGGDENDGLPIGLM